MSYKLLVVLKILKLNMAVRFVGWAKNQPIRPVPNLSFTFLNLDLPIGDAVLCAISVGVKVGIGNSTWQQYCFSPAPYTNWRIEGQLVFGTKCTPIALSFRFKHQNKTKLEDHDLNFYHRRKNISEHSISQKRKTNGNITVRSQSLTVWI